MSATAALILLMEAATACGTVPPDRPGGGAQIAPAILEFEPDVSERSALTLASAWQPLAEPEADSDEPEADPAIGQCRTVPIAIA